MPIEGEYIVNQPQPTAPVVNAIPKGHAVWPFSSFTRNPHGICFENQENDEIILLLIRRHFITNFPWITGVIGLIIIPFLIPILLPFLFPVISLSPNIQFSILLFYYLIIFGIILVNFSVWYFNIGIITDRRMVDIDVTGILFRNIAETKLELIQDVSYTQNGAIPSFFNYGNIAVQTAGNMPNFEFDQAPHPAEIVNIIGDLIKK